MNIPWKEKINSQAVYEILSFEKQTVIAQLTSMDLYIFILIYVQKQAKYSRILYKMVEMKIQMWL